MAMAKSKSMARSKLVNGSQNGLPETPDSCVVNVDLEVLRQKLADEDQFITQLLRFVPRSSADDEDQPDLSKPNLKRKADHSLTGHPDSETVNGGDSKRARNPEELRERLSEKLGQLKGKKLGFSDLKDKKKLKRKLDRLEKKKLKKEKQKSKMKIATLAQITKSPEENPSTQAAPKPPKPVFNSEGRMVFSKFDFGETGAPAQTKTKTKKAPKDPKALLGKLSKEKEKLQRLEKMGKADVAQQIAEKKAWENAIKRTEGEKVKDNPELLAKSAKRKENKKKQSKKKWAERIETVKNNQETRQKKRQENLKKKKTEKKDKKIKRLEKKGKIIKGI